MLTAKEAKSIANKNIKIFTLDDLEKGIKMMAEGGHTAWAQTGTADPETISILQDAGYIVKVNAGNKSDIIQIKW